MLQMAVFTITKSLPTIIRILKLLSGTCGISNAFNTFLLTWEMAETPPPFHIF